MKCCGYFRGWDFAYEIIYRTCFVLEYDMDMKVSLWNSYIEIDGRVGVIYNSFSDMFVVFRDLNLLKQVRSAESCKSIPVCVTKKMIAAGMLVPKDKDEIKDLEQIIKSNDDDDSCFHLIVNPTLDCNFHCWYCYESHVKDSCMSEDTVAAVQELLNDRVMNNDSLAVVHLSFFGGEPLLHFDDVVMPIMQCTRRLCSQNSIPFNVHFTTNAGLFTDEMIDALQSYSPSFQITLDGGKAVHDRTRFFKGGRPSFDLILRNVKKLLAHRMSVVLRINYTQKNIASVFEIVEFLKDVDSSLLKLLRVDLQRVWQDKSAGADEHMIDEILDEIKSRFKENGVCVSNPKIFDYVKDSCYADKRNEVLINYNGDVFSCTARDFVPQNRMGVLSKDGLIVWENDSLDKKMSCKFKKAICRSCRIAPLCGGGCRTKCMENAVSNMCNLGLDETKIDDLILERFESYFLANKN